MKNFDRVAEIYDATRGLPAGVPERIADGIIAAVGATRETQFLELGVGTGRIALAFVERGYRYTGVDISEHMMDRLRAKVQGQESNLTLVNADITALPFADASYDVATAVHVLHLIPDWRKALGEALRVLVPGGFMVIGYDRGQPGDPGDAIRRRWNELVGEAGVSLGGRGGAWTAVEEELTAAGAYTAVYRAANWEEELRPLDLLEEQRTRAYSRTWEVPDEVLEAVHERLLLWVTETYGPPERSVRSQREFMFSVSRFA